MPIIRSSRVLYSGCCVWQKIPHAATTVWYSWAPDDGHSDARNML